MPKWFQFKSCNQYAYSCKLITCQTDLKKLKRNPQLVKMPRVGDLLGTHPLVGMLPAAVRAPLLSNTKEKVKGHGAALYMEGSRATGIWIVSIGAVKVCFCLRLL